MRTIFYRSTYLDSQIICIKNPQCKPMPNKETQEPANCLHGQNLYSQPIFPPRSKPYQPQIQDRKVRTLNDLPFLIRRNTHQMQSMKKFQCYCNDCFRRILPLSDRRLQQPSPGVETRQAVTWTRNQPEELRRGVDEVENLGNK